MGGAVALAACATPPARAMQTQRFEFVSSGRRLVGLLDAPASGSAEALIVIVHGYGQTDVRGRTSYYDLRSRFTALGAATLIWDKPGCGESEGVFDANQPVENSAQEVLDAVSHARLRNAPGAHKPGLWGISRAGWIAPIAMAQEPGIGFWISVSGVDDKESFGYLLESNLRIEGRTEAEIDMLLGQWRHGLEISRSGGSYADYLSATESLRHDPFMLFLGSTYGEAAYLADQARYRSGAVQFDEATGLMIYVSDFDAMLARLHTPVLALFGERDTSVNWRSTAALYARTIGANPRARLTIRTFADGNHNIQQAQTGGLREMIEMQDRRACAGYYETMEAWLRREVLG